MSSGGREISPELRLLLLSKKEEKRPGDFNRRCQAVRAPFGGSVATDLKEVEADYFAIGFGVSDEELECGLKKLDVGPYHFLGRSRELGGSGYPSPWTALGVFVAIRACVGDPAGSHVAVQGAGFVGSHLVRLLTDAGAAVTVADHVPAKAAATGATVVSPDEILDVSCDVFSPNARDAALTVADVDRLHCRFVAGSMNEQIADDAAARRLVERGIRHVPEEIAGSGWILNIAAELEPGGWTEEVAATKVMAIEEIAREALEC